MKKLQLWAKIRALEDENRQLENKYRNTITAKQAIIDTQKVELARDLEIIRELKG